jgi:hypothetical protein
LTRDDHPDILRGLLIGLAVALAVAATAVFYECFDTKTLDRTVRRDAVPCGVNASLPGFSISDDKGNGRASKSIFIAQLWQQS